MPGTGDGVARLVEVSIMKVDMAQLSNDRAITPPAVEIRQRNEWNFRRQTCVETASAPRSRHGVKSELEYVSMVNRHWLGDLSLAVLLALPLAALAQPRANIGNDHTSVGAQVPAASPVSSHGRISLLG